MPAKLMYGVGGGSFGAVQSLPAGNSPRQLGIGDLTGNGLKDVVAVARSDDHLIVFLNICAPCVGDTDGDGQVNAADLALLLGAWGPNPDHPADLNGDGVVNAADLALLGGWPVRSQRL